MKISIMNIAANVASVMMDARFWSGVSGNFTSVSALPRIAADDRVTNRSSSVRMPPFEPRNPALYLAMIEQPDISCFGANLTGC